MKYFDNELTRSKREDIFLSAIVAVLAFTVFSIIARMVW